MELKERLGAGYRVYFGRGMVSRSSFGSRKTQASDIRKATDYWVDWKRRQA